MGIENLRTETGRIYREDGTSVNLADTMANATDPTGGIYTNTELQNAIHEGNAFSFDYDGTINGASSVYFMGITGDKQIHFDRVSGDFQKGGVRLWLYEAPTTTANGTAQAPVNLNFASTNAATMALYSAPTITDNGAKKTSRYFPITGFGLNISPANGDIALGRVLKTNTKYLFRVENTELTACTFGINFTWHDCNIILGV